MIIIAGTIDFVDQANRDGAVAAGVALQQSTRDTEPGCLEYSFAADTGVPTRVQIYEAWADETSLAAHFVHPNYLEMRKVLGSFQRAGLPSVAKYRGDVSCPIYDPQGKPRADFFNAP
jgi:quinol monooxygenase YgiN